MGRLGCEGAGGGGVIFAFQAGAFRNTAGWKNIFWMDVYEWYLRI